MPKLCNSLKKHVIIKKNSIKSKLLFFYPTVYLTFSVFKLFVFKMNYTTFLTCKTCTVLRVKTSIVKK